MTEPRTFGSLGLLLAALAGCGSDGSATTSTPVATDLTGIRFLAPTDDGDSGFARALEPRTFEFPADHGSHPAFRTEWWYFTGNLDAADARHFGFELTLFRLALSPALPASPSSLASNQVWMGNLAVSDVARRHFQAAERLSRGAAGLAGVVTPDTPGDAGRVIGVEDWSITIADDKVTLEAADEGFGIDLDLTDLTRIVAQGRDGLDAKGPEPGNASYYYSAPRLEVTGRIVSDGAEPLAVSGQAWMDHEWSTSALSADLVGWDWFALELDDGHDLMFYRLRRSDGATSRFSGGSIAAADGTLTRLAAADVELTALREWHSPATDVRYPVAWHLTLPQEALDLDVRPWLDDQEIDLTVRYWEGAVRVEGTAAGAPIHGRGYLELAGY